MNAKSMIVTASALLCISCGSGDSTSSTTMTPAELLGDWRLECTPNSQTNPQRAYITSDDRITNGRLVSTSRYYEDSACSVVGSPSSRVLSVSLSFPGGSTSTPLGEATHMNAVIQSVEFDGVALTDGSGESIYEVIGQEIHDLYFILDNALYYGQGTTDRNGQSADSRFSQLAQQYPYYRVE